MIRIVRVNHLPEGDRRDVDDRKVWCIPVRPPRSAMLHRGDLRNEALEGRLSQRVAIIGQVLGEHEFIEYRDIPSPVAALGLALFGVGGMRADFEVVDLVIEDDTPHGQRMLVTLSLPPNTPRWRRPCESDEEIRSIIDRHVRDHPCAVFLREVCR